MFTVCDVGGVLVACVSDVTNYITPDINIVNYTRCLDLNRSITPSHDDQGPLLCTLYIHLQNMLAKMVHALT